MNLKAMCNEQLMEMAANTSFPADVLLKPRNQRHAVAVGRFLGLIHVSIDNYSILSRNESYDAQTAAEYMKAIEDWAPIRRNLEFLDARNYVLESAAAPLELPVYSTNDMALILRNCKR